MRGKGGREQDQESKMGFMQEPDVHFGLLVLLSLSLSMWVSGRFNVSLMSLI